MLHIPLYAPDGFKLHIQHELLKNLISLFFLGEIEVWKKGRFTKS